MPPVRASRIDVNVFTNPLGDVHVTYEIDFGFDDQHIEELRFVSGGYVYDYQTFRGMTWPFGKVVRSIDVDQMSATDLMNGKSLSDIEISETKHGEHEIAVSADGTSDKLRIQFKLEDVVNRDAFFHKLVYTLSPLRVRTGENSDLRLVDIEIANIDVTVHFSHDIRSHLVICRKFNHRTGQPLDRWSTHWLRHILRHTDEDCRLESEQCSDVIELSWFGSLDSDEQLDIHVQGSNLPYMSGISRYRFWIVLWMLLFFVFVTSTYLSGLFF